MDYSLRLLECAQGRDLLAFAIATEGPDGGFPALLGVSVRNRRGVVDLIPREVVGAGSVICLIEYPMELGDRDDRSGLRCSGDVTFALWWDRTYERELARVAWSEWEYFDLWSVDPGHRIDPNTAAYVAGIHSMRRRYDGVPYWTAGRANGP